MKDFNFKKLGSRIESTRKSLKLTQEEVATSCCVHPSRIGYIERGQKEPSLRLLNKIASVLGVSIEKLVEGCGAI